MGTTTLAVRRTSLGRLLGTKSSQSLSSDHEAFLNSCIAEALRELYRRKRWYFLEHYEVVRLYASYQTGTVTVDISADDNDVTGSGTSWDTTWPGTWKLYTEGNTLRVSSIDSTTGITTTDDFPADVDGKTYVLYRDEYALSSSMKSIDSLWIDDPRNPLTYIAPAEMAQMRGTALLTGHPQFWTTSGVDSNGYPEIAFYPFPGYDENIHVQGQKAGTIPTADGHYDSVPDEFTDVVDKLARAIVYEEMGGGEDQRAQIERAKADRALLLMLSQCRINTGPRRIALDPKVFGTRRMTHWQGIVT